MENCYICGKKLSDDGYKGTVKRHKEHIIHNGLYGKSKSSNILCEHCGGAYSKSDAKFVELFSGFIELLRKKLISKDHGSTHPKRLKGFLYLSNGQKNNIEFCNGKVYPLTPYYEIDEKSRIIKLYGQKKRVNHYFNVLSSKYPEYSDFSIEHYDDISSMGNTGLFFSEGNSDFNNTFREGMCKIAAEFALHNNVHVHDLPFVLKLGKNNTSELLVDKAPIIPYMPQSSIELIMDLMEDIISYNYPIHFIRLYSENYGTERLLICFIELFSTFKYYVVLNSNYQGPNIDQCYCQSLLSKKDDESVMQSHIINVHNNMMELRDTVYSIISDYIKTSQLPILLFDPKTTKQIIDKTIEEEGMEQVIREMNDQISSENYYKNSVFHYNDGDSVIVSTFDECRRTAIDLVREYTFFKFNQLDRFCWNSDIIIEIKKR